MPEQTPIEWLRYEIGVQEKHAKESIVSNHVYRCLAAILEALDSLEVLLCRFPKIRSVLIGKGGYGGTMKLMDDVEEAYRKVYGE